MINIFSRVLQAAPSSSGVNGINAFAFDLYGQLKSTPGNLFFSPYSISSCLAMTYDGARGETEKQMAQVLHFGGDQARVHSSFADLQRQLATAGAQKGVELDVANALWAQQGHPFLPEFLKIAKSDYQANVNQANFRTGASAATREINDWVAQKTKDKIKDILPPGSLSEMTRLVLANAIYFKGQWAEQFRPAQTTTQPFHINATAQINAPLMYRSGKIRYMETSTFQAVELPYQGDQLAMMILLPREIDGCAKLEAQLSADSLSKSIAQMKVEQVDLSMPKFEMASDLKLKELLQKLGMPDAFGDKADFSGMDGAKDLYLSAVFHKAWVDVNEEGTEAAAATAVTVAKREVARPVSPPIVFRADHPFIFLIRDTQAGAVLFLGRLANPSK